MPAPIFYSHRLVERQAQLRKAKILPWLRPDAKSQVTLRYENGKPVAVDAVVLSTQHNPDVKRSVIREAVMEEIIKKVLPAEWLHAGTKYHQPDRPVHHRWPSGRLRSDRTQDHC